MKKFKLWLAARKSSKIFAVCAALCLLCSSVVSAFADVPTTSDIVGGVTTVTGAVTSAFNISTIAEIIGVVLAGCVGLFLFWWGARKVVRMVSKAFTKGKISL